MPRRPHFEPPVFHPDRPGLVLPVRVDPSGGEGPTRMQARGARWRRTSHGFYVPAAIDEDDVDQRILEVGHHLNDDSALTGWASLRWQKARYFGGLAGDGKTRLPVPVTSIRRSVRRQAGMRVVGECIPDRWIHVVDGLRVTKPVAAVAFEMRYARSISAAVRAFDMAAADDLVSLDELLEHLEWLNHWIGIPRARKAALWCDENAWSPPEVDVRLVWPRDLGLPAPVTNRPIFDVDGNHLGTPDLLELQPGLVVEYDGVQHLDPDNRARDLVRADRFRAAGLEVIELVSADRRDRGRLNRRIVEARARALASSSHRKRRWTLDQPAWWTPTHTVAMRRALTPAQRERLLRYRTPVADPALDPTSDLDGLPDPVGPAHDNEVVV